MIYIYIYNIYSIPEKGEYLCCSFIGAIVSSQCPEKCLRHWNHHGYVHKSLIECGYDVVWLKFFFICLRINKKKNIQNFVSVNFNRTFHSLFVFI